jgi:hypothetical protein
MIIIPRILDDIQLENQFMEMNQHIMLVMVKMVLHGYHHRHHQHQLIYQMIMELLQIQLVYVYHQWQVFDLNKERHIQVMAMNKQCKQEKHLAKHYNLYEIQ